MDQFCMHLSFPTPTTVVLVCSVHVRCRTYRSIVVEGDHKILPLESHKDEYVRSLCMVLLYCIVLYTTKVLGGG